MVGNAVNAIESLHTHVAELISRHNALRQQCKTLKEELREKNEKVAEMKTRLESIEAKYQNLLMAQAVVAENGDCSEARSRFEKLVREIDKCISLLND